MAKVNGAAGEFIRNVGASAGAGVSKRCNLFQRLLAEHREIEAALERIDTCEVEDRAVLYAELLHEMAAHAEAESTYLYGLFGRHPRTAESVQQAERSHRELELSIQQLATVSLASEGWRRGFRALRWQLEAHIEFEEEELFARARLLLEREDVEALGAKYLEARRAAHAKLL